MFFRLFDAATGVLEWTDVFGVPSGFAFAFQPNQLSPEDIERLDAQTGLWERLREWWPF